MSDLEVPSLTGIHRRSRCFNERLLENSLVNEVGLKNMHLKAEARKLQAAVKAAICVSLKSLGLI